MIDISDLLLQIANTTASSIPTTTATNTLDSNSNTETLAAILGGGGIVGATATAIKTLLNGRHQKEDEKATDFDIEHYMELRNLEDNYTLKHPDKSRAEVLQLPAYPDQPALKITLGEALAKEYHEWKQYNIRKYYQKK